MNRLNAINPLHVFILLAALMVLSGIIFTGVQKAKNLLRLTTATACVSRSCQ